VITVINVLTECKEIMDGLADEVCPSFLEMSAKCEEAIDSLQSSDPVAWVSENGNVKSVGFQVPEDGSVITPLYDHTQMVEMKDPNEKWIADAQGPITPNEAKLLMDLMDGAISGDHVALLGRISEGMLYNKLSKIAEEKQ